MTTWTFSQFKKWLAKGSPDNEAAKSVTILIVAQDKIPEFYFTIMQSQAEFKRLDNLVCINITSGGQLVCQLSCVDI
jgi:hypothetical protein